MPTRPAPLGRPIGSGSSLMFAQPPFRNFPLQRTQIHLLLEGRDLDPSTALRSENVHYDWASMDATLSRKQFPRLERVTLSLGSFNAQGWSTSRRREAVRLCWDLIQHTPHRGRIRACSTPT